jgi:hypothetical protein
VKSPISTPELYKEYPVIMTSGIQTAILLLASTEYPWLRSFMEYPTCQITPIQPKVGIEDGTGLVESPRARSGQKCRVFPGILRVF